jgi:hypothetical protein
MFISVLTVEVVQGATEAEVQASIGVVRLTYTTVNISTTHKAHPSSSVTSVHCRKDGVGSYQPLTPFLPRWFACYLLAASLREVNGLRTVV